MKLIGKVIIIAVAMFIPNKSFAQDENNPWVVTIATNAVDTYPTNQKKSTNLGDTGKLFQDFYKTKNWNFIPNITTFGVSRNILQGYSLTGRISTNQISKIGEGAAASDLFYGSFDC